ncbi:MAG: MFS transporter, partial [Thermoplasmata archaeon]|nr:MFS transporter [Thermoplasmata archaeon]
MATPEPEDADQRRAREDRGLIYIAKTLRAVAYGALSAFLFLYLSQDLGFSTVSSLALTSLSLIGSAAWNFVAVGPLERRFGRRRSLWIFGGLFTASAALLWTATNPIVVLAAVLLGGVAAATADNGPLASLDQAILPSTLRRRERTKGFARYNLLAYFASAGGALLLAVPGSLIARQVPFLPSAPHPWIGLIYLVLAAATWMTYLGVSARVDAPLAESAKVVNPPSDETRRRVRDFAVLFGVDAFAGGLLINPIIAAYFVVAWHQGVASIGLILFLAGMVAGTGLLLAEPIAARIGLLRTMVFTHLPSNIFLILVPLMPTLTLSVGMLLARFALSQMDVPTRQSYTMGLVEPRDRGWVSARFSGVRAVSQSAGPFPAVALDAAGYLAAPFLVGGALKVAY